MQTKIQKILNDRSLSQGDLQVLIEEKSGFIIGRDRISKICAGKIKNYTIETAVLISEALEVKIDNIIEIKNLKKKNTSELKKVKASIQRRKIQK